jgi:hypothetical protein
VRQADAGFAALAVVAVGHAIAAALRNVEHALMKDADLRPVGAFAREVGNEALAGRPLAKLVRTAEMGIDDETAACVADLAPAPPDSAIKSAKASAAQSPKNFGIESSLGVLPWCFA